MRKDKENDLRIVLMVQQELPIIEGVKNKRTKFEDYSDGLTRITHYRSEKGRKENLI